MRCAAECGAGGWGRAGAGRPSWAAHLLTLAPCLRSASPAAAAWAGAQPAAAAAAQRRQRRARRGGGGKHHEGWGHCCRCGPLTCRPHAGPAAPMRVQVRAGTGGDEACLFALELFRMYERYAAAQGWKFEVGCLAAWLPVAAAAGRELSRGAWVGAGHKGTAYAAARPAHPPPPTLYLLVTTARGRLLAPSHRRWLSWARTTWAAASWPAPPFRARAASTASSSLSRGSTVCSACPSPSRVRVALHSSQCMPGCVLQTRPAPAPAPAPVHPSPPRPQAGACTRARHRWRCCRRRTRWMSQCGTRTFASTRTGVLGRLWCGRVARGQSAAGTTCGRGRACSRWAGGLTSPRRRTAGQALDARLSRPSLA